MKMRQKYGMPAMLAGSVLVLSANRLDAQLLTNMNFNQQVEADYTTFQGPLSYKSPVVSTTTPIYQTVSANDGMGGTASATYNVSVSSSVAVISINASGSATAVNNGYKEGTILPLATTFYLSEPSTFSFTAAISGTGILEFASYDGSNEFAGFNTLVTTQTDTGILPAGPISLTETWGSGDVTSPDPIPESGTYSLSLTFTAIPEPSSACLIGIPVIASLLRRRRRVRLVPESA